MAEEIPDPELIALTASKIADIAEREVYIEKACGGDEALKNRVRALIEAMTRPASDDLAVTLDTAGEDKGTQSRDFTVDYDPKNETEANLIGGRYKILKRIGEGGMGTVWAAEQREPVTRTVALKLIKKGMDSVAVLARFEAERQALAIMDHPNIARIFDGGITDEGVPYFVMELVKGEPITDFCDSHRLTPEQRLELFVPVCQAIQHAHHKGIIHRDIKPSNVLVTMVDDRPVPKVIDFGVAKATGQALTELSLDTGFGVVGTPQYMSPEQASMNSIDIDTRSDVYSLGVLLYELLAGSTPFRKDELAKAGYLEILRVIREVDPPRPSTKLSTAEALPSLSAARGTDPKRLSLLLRNELDWIVMRALEKDRVRRYETANAFAADINRYLHGEPVQAHPPTVGYRLKKFLRKNRGPVIAATLVACAVVAGFIGTSLGMLEARRQARLAREESNLKEEARAIAESERQAAERERAIAEQRLNSARQTISTVVNNIPNLLERVPLASGPLKIILGQMDELLSKTSDNASDDNRFDSSRAWGQMAVETRSGQQALLSRQLDVAELHFRSALKIAKEVYDGEPRDRAKAAGNLAMAYALLADLAATREEPQASNLIREAIKLREEAIQIEQAEDSLGKRRANLGNTWNRLAGIESRELDVLPAAEVKSAAQSAIKTCRIALQHLQAAVEELENSHAEQATARRDLGVAAINLASLAQRAEDDATELEAHELANRAFSLLASSEPDRVYYRMMLADVCGLYGDYLLIRKQDPVAARVQYATSMKLLRELFDSDAQLDQLRRQRDVAYYRLGLAAEGQGNAEQVRKYFERAALISDLHLRERSDRVKDLGQLIDDQEQLMLEQAWAGQASSAVATARSIKTQIANMPRADELPWVPIGLARAAFAIAIASEQAELSAADRKSAGAEALQTLQQAIALGYNDFQYLQTDPDVAPLRRVEGFESVVHTLQSKQ